MVRKIVALFGVVLCLTAVAGENIVLSRVSDDPGKSIKESLQNRKSSRSYADKELSLQQLSDLLWAANGFNRPKMRTNATGMNKQSIEIYVCMAKGAYRYDAADNTLVWITDEDLRPAVAGRQAFAATAPVCLVVAADLSDPIYNSERGVMMSAYDAGIVSGNIYLFCSANDLATICRLTMDVDKLKTALKLSEKHYIHLNHPVGLPQ